MAPYFYLLRRGFRGPSGPKYSTVQYNIIQYSILQYSTVQYSTVQYSTVQYSNRRGGWCPYSTLCGVSVTGAASLVAECGTNILFKKHFKKTFLGHFQKSVTESEHMCKSVMASSSKKMVL